MHFYGLERAFAALCCGLLSQSPPPLSIISIMCSSSLVAANPDIRRSLDKGGLVQEGGMGLTLLLHGPSHLADVCLHSVCITHLEARAEASMGGARQKHDSRSTVATSLLGCMCAQRAVYRAE